MSRQGKVRLAKWYSTYTQKERQRVTKEITPLILARPLKLCNFLDWKNIKLIYKRYASLYFACGVDAGDNELITLEIIHEFVEVLDRYFGNVCELDLIFNFHKAYYILDELLIAGEMHARHCRPPCRTLHGCMGCAHTRLHARLEHLCASLWSRRQNSSLLRLKRNAMHSYIHDWLWLVHLIMENKWHHMSICLPHGVA